MGGDIAILDGISGDLQYFAQTFGLHNYSMNERMCHLCHASKVIVRTTNGQEVAPHLQLGACGHIAQANFRCEGIASPFDATR
jgi:hypothetical protein